MEQPYDSIMDDFVWPVMDGVDTRKPLFTIEYQGEEFGFYFLSISGWVVFLSLIIAETLVSALVAVFLYYTVVEPRKDQKPGPPLLTVGSIATFGVVIPFWILAPDYLVRLSGFKNKLLRFVLGTVTPTASLFRAVEALFGFTPAYATASLRRFVLVYSCPLVLRYDDGKSNKWVGASGRQVVRHLLRFVGFLVLTAAYMSCFFSLSFTPYLADPSSRPDDFYSRKRWIDPTNWKDSMARALIFQLCLSTFGEGLALATTFLTGIKTDPIMGNPLLESTSPSEFWGFRWNRLFHTILKQGVYKPVRSLGGSQFVAILATFVASGLFHERALLTVFYDIADGVPLGGTTLFFVWQGGLVAAEFAIGHWSIFGVLARHLPGSARTLLLVLAGVPVAHLFMDLYVHSDYFRHFMILGPCVLPLDR